MKKILATGFVIFWCSSYAPAIHAQVENDLDPLPPLTLTIQPIVTGVEGPTAMAFPEKDVIWLLLQKGLIRVIKNGKMTDAPLLDLRGKMIKVNDGYEERGLLGIALHPRFKTNRKFYVFYSAPSTNGSNHKDVVAEYRLSPSGVVDPGSARIILSAEKPDGNHDGGCLQFGPDGYLYITFGDGGGQGDKHGEFGNGQKMDTWLGKILRVDVNTKVGYLVPKDNPFVGKKGVSPEIWAYGFRNPYRISFDKATGTLFAGDVGQDLWEEVDIVRKGANYGWRLFEGTHPYNPASGTDPQGIIMPITEYSHKEGISVIGGYVYNGHQVPVLQGKYLFCDWSGPVWYLQKQAAGWLRGKVTLQGIIRDSKITGFSEDPSGELYLTTNTDTGLGKNNGAVFKIVK
jgi:glucose/arabinose dehydrogenase